MVFCESIYSISYDNSHQPPGQVPSMAQSLELENLVENGSQGFTSSRAQVFAVSYSQWSPSVHLSPGS